MKPNKIFACFVTCFLCSNIINSRNTSEITKYHMEDRRIENSPNYELVKTFNVSGEKIYWNDNLEHPIYSKLPEIGTCWEISTQEQYNQITKTDQNDINFDNYEIFIASFTTIGCTSPAVTVDLLKYVKKYTTIYITPILKGPQCKIPCPMVISFKIPKEYLDTIVTINKIDKWE